MSDFAIFLLNGGARAIKLPDGTRVEHVDGEWLVTRPDGSSAAYEYRFNAIEQAELWGGHSHASYCACRHWTRAD